MGMAAVTRRLSSNPAVAWLVAGLGGGVAHVVLWWISEPPDIFSDFYKAYYPAAEYLWEDGLNATWPLTEAAAGGFVNIPIIAWLFLPLVPLGEQAAGWTFLATGGAATMGAWMLLCKMARLDAYASAALLLAFLVNGPLVNSLREGNTTHFILLLLLVAVLLLRSRHDFGAGLVLGLCAIVKLPLMLFGVYFLLRGRWSVVAGGATMIGLICLLSLAIYGVEGNIAWYRDSVEPFLGKIIPAFNVQSIDGFLMRLGTGDRLLRDWDPVEPAAAHRIARLLIFAAMAAAAVWLLRRPLDERPAPAATGRLSQRDLLEFVLVLNFALVISPISWTHYYLWLLLPWGLHLGGQLSIPDDRTTRWLMTGSLVLISLPAIMLPLQPGFWSDLAARTVVSAWLFGGLLMLAALTRGLWWTTKPRAGSLREA